MKRCPACHKEFADTATHCEIDGHALEASSPAPNDPGANQAQTLADFIKQHAPLAIERAARVAIAICQAVEELQRAGQAVSLLHPHNLAIESRGQTEKIALRKPLAAEVAPGEDQLPERAAAYLSPEAAQQQPTDAASVVYSIGAMLYEMLTGQPPFTAASAAAIRVKHILEPPRPLINLRPEIPLPLQAVTLRALEKESAARQASPAQLQRELEAALAELRAAAESQVEPTGVLNEPEPPLMDVFADLEPPIESAPTGALVQLPLGESLDEASAPELLASRYRVEKSLGQGGMGYIARAKDVRVNRAVVLKKIPLDPSRSSEIVARARRAAALWSRIRHPNVVAVYDVFETEDALYIVMEFVEGKPLSDIIREQRSLPLDRVANITRQMAEALDAAHQLGIVHGDFKPGRVIVGEQAGHPDVVKVGGFTYARSTSANEQPETQIIVGTPAYMSPEQFTGEPLDARSDLYSLALVIYEMLSGVPPFASGDMMQMMMRRLNEGPLPLRDVSYQSTPREVESVIMKALARKPEDRYSSTREFAGELNRASQPDADDSVAPGGAYEVRDVSTRPSPAQASRPPLAPSDMAPLPPTTLASPMAPPRPQASPPTARASKTGAALAIVALAVALVAALYFARSALASVLPVALIVVAVGIVLLAIILILRYRQPAAPQPPLARIEGPSESLRTGPAFVPRSSEPIAPTAVRRKRPSGRAGAGSSEPIAPTAASQSGTEVARLAPREQTPQTEVSKRCPTCRTEFPSSMQFCVRDGTRLEEETKAQTPQEAPSFYDLQTIDAVKRCPACGAEYPMTNKFCRRDGEPLGEVTSGSSSSKQPDAIEPFTIAQYLCFAQLGEGGMGVVYKARHIHLERLSAVKVLLPGIANLPDAVSRFKREAQIASRINHPNSVTIYDYGEMGARLFYIAMEFISGLNLAEIIHPKALPPRPLPLQHTLNITRQICDALDAAHRDGIVHRDLKPQNVMISERAGKPDMVKVVDFGIARSLQSQYQSLSGTLVGTPAYMSPEQARMEMNLDARTDIFSLAVMVYEMLGGQLPFSTAGQDIYQQVNRRAALAEPPPPLSSLRPELQIPAAMDAVLASALAPDRNERTPSAALFIEQMEHAAHL